MKCRLEFRAGFFRGTKCCLEFRAGHFRGTKCRLEFQTGYFPGMKCCLDFRRKIIPGSEVAWKFRREIVPGSEVAWISGGRLYPAARLPEISSGRLYRYGVLPGNSGRRLYWYNMSPGSSGGKLSGLGCIERKKLYLCDRKKLSAMSKLEKKKEKIWYVLYTAPRAEKQVEERIRLAGVTCWLPLHRAPRVWSDRVKLVDLPLFPSYVFVQCETYKLYDLLRLTGVVRIVYYDGKPAVVQEREMDAIRQFLVEAMNHPLLEGDEAEILCGALKHVSGKVRHIRKKYVVLYIEQLGATVSVKLDEVAALNRLR